MHTLCVRVCAEPRERPCVNLRLRVGELTQRGAAFPDPTAHLVVSLLFPFHCAGRALFIRPCARSKSLARVRIRADPASRAETDQSRGETDVAPGAVLAGTTRPLVHTETVASLDPPPPRLQYLPEMI